MEEEVQQQKTLVLFGRDLMKIPCFRTTFMYSIPSYFGVGLLTFLFTSRPAFSSHVGFASFMAITLGYFTKCRTDWERQKREITKMIEMADDEMTTITSKSYIKGNEPILTDA